MKRLAIIASGELGMQIAHLASLGSDYTVVGFFDDTEPTGAVKNGYTILGPSEAIENAYANGDFDHLIIGIGYKHLTRRKELFEKYKDKIPYANIIHPTCYIDPTARLGEGIVMYPGCIIDKEVALSDNVLLNLGICVAHNTSIGPHSFLAPRVQIAGASSIGECAYLGIGTTVIDNLVICDNVHTGAATVIVKSINNPGLYIGSPAKFHRA